MKYVKTFEVKRRDKDTDKYLPYLYEIFDDAMIITIVDEYVDSFSINLKYRVIYKENLKKILETFKDYDIDIKSTYGNCVTTKIIVSSDFWKPFDIKINAKKYNIL
jgi:hypothetical protein